MAPAALKRLEKAGQAALFGAARLLFSSSRGSSSPGWDATPHRVLYLRYDRIGDMIMATGLIRVIATSHPGLSLDVLASPANAPVLEGNPHVDRVLLFDRRDRRDLPRVARALRNGRYDAVIDGMVLTPSVTMMLLMLASGARYRIGIGGRRNDFVYTHPVAAAPADAHIIEQSARTAIPFGVDPAAADLRPELYLRSAELDAAQTVWGARGRRILINVSAVTPDRQWPRERYAAIVRESVRVAHEGTVLLISAPGERATAHELAAETGATVAATPTIRHAFALIATADAVFTPDTSISHAAAALQVPLAVMIPARSVFGPYGAQHIRIESPGRTLTELPLSQALDGLRDLLVLAAARSLAAGRG